MCSCHRARCSPATETHSLLRSFSTIPQYSATPPPGTTSASSQIRERFPRILCSSRPRQREADKMATTPVEHPTTTHTLPTRQKPLPYAFDNGRRTQLSSVLPPLIFGTATFNVQYNSDPFALDTTGLVTSALTHGIRAFDTSPYYGPSEQLLGNALATPFVRETFPRNSYMILTKVGRIASEEFDYSKAWVRQSVANSLENCTQTILIWCIVTTSSL